MGTIFLETDQIVEGFSEIGKLKFTQLSLQGTLG